jgi:hypothetical protein
MRYVAVLLEKGGLQLFINFWDRDLLYIQVIDAIAYFLREEKGPKVDCYFWELIIKWLL